MIKAWFFTKKRMGTYWPIVYAAFIAAFLRISLVMHEYFPKKYFKYIALSVIINHNHRSKTVGLTDKKDWILKQYQEAHDKNVCPICDKPVRIGPLLYAAGGTLKCFLLLEGRGPQATEQQIYTCPSCGTQLYDKCDKLNAVTFTIRCCRFVNIV